MARWMLWAIVAMIAVTGFSVGLRTVENGGPAHFSAWAGATPPTGSSGSGFAIRPPSIVPSAGLTVTLTVNRTNSPVDSPITFWGNVSPSTGAPFNLSWSGLPGGCASTPPLHITSGSISYPCMPTQVGSFTAMVTVSNGTGASGSNSAVGDIYADLAVTLSLAPGSLSSGTQLQVSFQISGGAIPFTLQWSGLPSPCPSNAPGAEASAGTSQFQCNPTQTGTSQVRLQVTDSGTPSHSIVSAQQSLQVNSNNNNNNNHSGNGSNNRNGSGNFSIPGLSNLGSLLSIFLIGALVVFILLVITAVSTLATAILVARRLPPRNRAVAATGATIPCPSCGKPVPVDSKFCLNCGKPIAPEKAT